MTKIKIEAVKIEKPEEVNFILATSHFIKTVEDVYEALVSAVPNIKFGLAFLEASGPRKIRFEGTDEAMVKLAIENGKRLGVGHSLLIFLANAYPINVLPHLRSVPEIVTFHCATANPLEIIVGQTGQGRAILGVVDGGTPQGVETEEGKKKRKEFLRQIGYKLNL